MAEQNNKYDRVAVFSGGGTRFAIYCGMFAAMEDAGMSPNLIIGACGGAIATTIINALATNEERKKYLQSEELYKFVRATELTNERMLYRIGWYCLKKMYSKRNAPYIEDVFSKYLVNMPEDLTTLLPTLSSETKTNIPSIIIGSKMLFDPSETGKARNGKKLYKKVLFTDKITAQKINCNDIEIRTDYYISGAIDPSIEVMTNVPMVTAMRISVSDMFYVQPVYYGNHYFAGGAIDLIPMELATAMGETIFFEKKSPYSTMEESLVRAVLGYSGNERLKEIGNGNVKYWIDTRDATQALNGHYCKKNIDWAKFRISISLPDSHEQFAEDMEIQWQYGYRKVMEQTGL